MPAPNVACSRAESELNKTGLSATHSSDRSLLCDDIGCGKAAIGVRPGSHVHAYGAVTLTDAIYTSPATSAATTITTTTTTSTTVLTGTLQYSKMALAERLASTSDYARPDFDTNTQMAEVEAMIRKAAMMPNETIQKEISWFYNNLGIESIFFKSETVEKISEFILSVYAAKILSYTKHKTTVDINLEHETDKGAIYLCNSQPGVSVSHGPLFEKKIDQKYLNRKSDAKDVYRVETYRSKGFIADDTPVQLRCYFVDRSEFDNPNADAMETNLQLIGSRNFLERASDHTKVVYQDIINKAVTRNGPVIQYFFFPEQEEARMVVAYRRGDTVNFFSSVSDLYHFYDLFSTRKFVEQFSNGLVVVSTYLKQLPESKSLPLETAIHQLAKEVSLLYALPSSPLQPLFYEKKLSMQAISYSYCAWKFAEHFLNRLGPEYEALQKALDVNKEEHSALLMTLKTRLRLDTFTSEFIFEIVQRYPELVRLLYQNFASVHRVQNLGTSGNGKLQRNPSMASLDEEDLSHEAILKRIKSTVLNPKEYMVFECFLMFNKHILKTNFFQPTKVALSFRLDPRFLPKSEYQKEVFGMFFIVGAEFRGFHVRFADVARGGIRIVRSANREIYSRNSSSLFDENYNLALTQQRKNKDIPEGGSKGTILLDIVHQDKAEIAFKKYVDAILDLLLIGQSPGIKDTIVDLYKLPEILFFGPDEGTADYMDWASRHARFRNAGFWNAFTTGKSPEIGGIPHDLYGMTTRSVHQYVIGILSKVGIKEEDCTKMQTGGPDGDLGSNEIKISKDRTIGIVDGSGVIYDPNGLDREELRRLANGRKMVMYFDVAKLGPGGFRVLIEDRDVTLPDGTIIENGTNFRNTFHLHPLARATLFVPCGGRPEAVNLTNVHSLFDEKGEPKFKYIVEGANLFFTQDARLLLEKAGVVVFKDASANKGGVTSSSMEVFAALALNDDEFEKHLCAKNGVIPQFRERYVRETQEFIERNAALEFECLWRAHEKSGVARSVLSDRLSNKIVQLSNDLEQSALWDNAQLRNLVLSEYCPPSLLDLLGLDTLIKRVPESYLRAIFGCFLASRFVYSFGLDYSPFAFFEFMNAYSQKATASKAN